MAWLLSIFTLTGFNFIFWSSIGLLRYIIEHSLNPFTFPRWFEERRIGISALALTCIIFITSVLVRAVIIVPIPLDNLSNFFRSDSLFLALGIWILAAFFTGYITARAVGRRDFVSIGTITIAFCISLNMLMHNAISDDAFIILNGIFFPVSAISGVLLGGFFGAFITNKEAHNNQHNLSLLNYSAASAISVSEVAVLIAAHNEEVAIGETISALKKIIPKENIFVGSDASADRTVEIVKQNGCNVVDIQPNRGKARVLVHLIEHFSIIERYKAALILDADIIVDEHFFEYALPPFNDQEISAVIGHAYVRWFPHLIPRFSMFVSAYRIRLWRVLMYSIRYSQTWKYLNILSIIPGGSSIYRTSVLKHLEIDAPGLLIEDFNMTFEMHRKRLGKIHFDPRAFVWNQEPYNIRDFMKQVKRWFIGFWQTVHRHGFWPSLFWYANALYISELILYSITIIFIPVFFAYFIINNFEPLTIPFLGRTPWREHLTFGDIFFGIFVADYAVTVIVTIIEKKPVLLIYGLFFFILRYIEALVYLLAIPIAFTTKSIGQWVSPMRRAFSDQPSR